MPEVATQTMLGSKIGSCAAWTSGHDSSTVFDPGGERTMSNLFHAAKDNE
jgi:hypothetical protein